MNQFADAITDQLRTLWRSAQQFDTFSEAFAACRDRNAPLVVIVTEQCNDCCNERDGNPKRIHKIYPSGSAIAFAIPAPAQEVRP